jgi:hypothetical protein
MGRVFHCAQGYRPWILSLTVSEWPGGTKFLEYWISTSVSSLINWGHLLLVSGDWYYQYNFVLPVHDWYYTQVYWRGIAPILPPVIITSFRLVSWVTKGALRSNFEYNAVLLVYNWYYVQICWRGVTPLFLVTYYLFLTCTFCYFRGLAPTILVYN